ncbi:integrase core domain-containing protein [Jiella pelagia]|uniref:Integrase core domain-containing protein n=1 Tax=Jiella pelagia TaxID=2986949 RepID=A0ABY7C494_9HYPH|nr:integrase core domain-containing protein [Jiella pelagia]WAP69859.1 integrase core domain-containing protein [Jiella pelagia]
MTEDRLPLAELLAKAGEGDFLRVIAESVMQLLMEADVEGVIGAGRHERTLERATYRNGYRDRSLDTRLGSLQLRIPKLRQGSFGKPGIFNTDQGSQFTSPRFTAVLTGAGVRVSMDGRGRWMDNVFIERLWRSLKYECIYLHAFETGSETRAGIAKWMTYYNVERPHSTHGGKTPADVHGGTGFIKLAA